MRVFLDANVIFAAAISPDGRCKALFDLAVRQKKPHVSIRKDERGMNFTQSLSGQGNELSNLSVTRSKSFPYGRLPV
ncbi:MAG: PIN domain-containing protein [Moorea sp. SIO3G5]|nr:PIN domain-containing protein [Moorena sp. SIO3G5]